MPTRAVIVHGYSENSLAAYARFPQVLKATAPELQEVIVSAFNSLDDGVTIDDLADALEIRMRAVEERPGWKTSDAVFICHSTGALAARRWMLNRVKSDRELPSHLITMAGANHGSSLAQLGPTPLGYVHQFLNKHTFSVGRLVLRDLDYGSDFLLRLNREWLAARNGDPSSGLTADGRMSAMHVFSMGGDSKGDDPAVKLLWASNEVGSDNTVRVSGANLNYTYLVADQAAGTLKAVLSQPQAHLVVPNYSHYGSGTGILASNASPADPPMQAIREALNAETNDVPAEQRRTYDSVRSSWDVRMKAWCVEKPDDANSTILFYLHDRGGGSIEDCFIGLLDASVPGLDAEHPQADSNILVAALQAVSDSILSRQPIHNDVQRGSYSFYVKEAAFNALASHMISIEAKSGSSAVAYGPLNYRVDHATVEQMVFANQFTYIDVTMPRITDATYVVYDTTTDRPETEPIWPPFTSIGRISPPADAGNYPPTG
jgi:hypothetical protein